MFFCGKKRCGHQNLARKTARFYKPFVNHRGESKSRRAGLQEKFVKFFTISARLIMRIRRNGIWPAQKMGGQQSPPVDHAINDPQPGSEDFGLRWQSAAATPLFGCEPSFQSGVALRFPRLYKFLRLSWRRIPIGETGRRASILTIAPLVHKGKSLSSSVLG